MSYFIYIVICKDNSFYIGVTNNLERRVCEHNNGMSDDSYTKTRLPVILIYYEEYKEINEAIRREKQLKKWTHAKKRALIRKQFKILVDLSHNHGSTSSP